MNTPISAHCRAELSGGFSGGQEYYEFVVRGLESALRGSNVLDLGCGKGGFGRFFRERFYAQPHGVDIVQHAGFIADAYASFQIANLDALETAALPGGQDFVFALGLIEYLTNPRRFIHAAAAALRPGGHLIITAPNPASLRSLAALLRSGEFSAFKELSNPASITPVLAMDAARMLREVGLQCVTTDFSNRGSLPGSGRYTWQRIVPATRGRWFSDDFRVVGVRPS